MAVEDILRRTGWYFNNQPQYTIDQNFRVPYFGLSPTFTGLPKVPEAPWFAMSFNAPQITRTDLGDKLPKLPDILPKQNTGLIGEHSLPTFGEKAVKTIKGLAGNTAVAGAVATGAELVGDAINEGKGTFDLQSWKKAQSGSLTDYVQAAGNANTTSDLLTLSDIRPDFIKKANDIEVKKYDAGKSLSAAGKGAMAGASIGSIIPGLGTVVGGAIGAGIGWLTNNIGQGFGIMKDNKDKSSAVSEAEKLDGINALAMRNGQVRVSNNTYRQGMANFLNNAAFGGPLFTHGADFTDDLIRIDAGGTHEQNPYGGVPAGVDPNGIPNLVEEGEIIWDDYVFSDRLKMPKSLMKKYKLGGRKDKAISFAEGVDKITEKLGTELRPNDSITQNTKDEILGEFEEVQEKKRMKQQQRNLVKAMSEMTPEEFQAMMVNPLMGQAPAVDGYQMPAQAMAAQPQEEPVGLMPPGMMGFGGHLFSDGGPKSRAGKDAVAKGRHYDPKTGNIYNSRGVVIFNDNDAYNTEETQRYNRKLRGQKKLTRAQELLEENYIKEETPEQEVQEQKPTEPVKKEEAQRPKTTMELLRERKGDVAATKSASATQSPSQSPSSIEVKKKPEGSITIGNIEGPKLYSPEKTSTGTKSSVRKETRPDNSIFTSDWDTFYNTLRGYSPSTQRGGVAGTYAIDRQFPYGNFNNIEELENSKEYQDFTKYVLEHGDDKDVQNYLRELDKGTHQGVEKLFDGDTLKDNWKTLYENRRTDHKGGIYHFSRMAPDGTPEVSEDRLPRLEGITPQGRAVTSLGNTPNGYKGLPEPGDTDITESTTTKGVIGNDLLPTWMRYAPIVGSGISVLSDLFSRPDYSKYEDIIADAERVGSPVNIPVVTIGNKIRRNPFDERLAVNQANQNLASSIRSTMDTAGGNRAYRQYASNLLAYNNQNQLADIARNAYLANRQDALQTADFNRQTDLYNMNAINQRNLTQGQLNANRQYQGFMARMNAVNALENAKRYDDQLVSADFTGLMQNLGNLGRENFEFNRLNAMAREGYYPIMYDGKTGDMAFVPYAGVKVAKGGKVKTKKKRRF